MANYSCKVFPLHLKTKPQYVCYRQTDRRTGRTTTMPMAGPLLKYGRL